MSAMRELLAAATPRPWREGTSSGAVVADALAPGEDPSGRAEPDTIAYYGGVIVGESILNADRELVVRVVNEYEALLDLEEAARRAHGHLPTDSTCRECVALAKLDEVRRAG